jgi:antitoxin ParD1/3/4
MDISLPPQLEELVKHKVDSGQYNCASEVVVEALWLLDARDRFREVQTEELRKEIQKGLDSGLSIPGDEFFSRLREKATKRAEQEK